MTSDNTAATTAANADAPEVRQLRNRIERTRVELGHTVESLMAKTDVKARSTDTLRLMAERGRERVRGIDARLIAAGAAVVAAAGIVDAALWFIRRRSPKPRR